MLAAALAIIRVVSFQMVALASIKWFRHDAPLADAQQGVCCDLEEFGEGNNRL
jgi:hypothetical protein